MVFFTTVVQYAEISEKPGKKWQNRARLAYLYGNFALCVLLCFYLGEVRVSFHYAFPQGKAFWVCKQKSADFSADFYIINII